MSKKIPEAIFTAKAVNGKIVVSEPDHLNFYAIEHDNEELFVHVEPIVQLPEKMKLYAYYHVNILQCAVIGYTAAGYPGIDTVKADYLLRAEFAKDFIRKPDGSYTAIMLDKRNMTKTRLLKFAQDCIFFIETELGIIVPSSEEFKIKKATGKNFKEIK